MRRWSLLVTSAVLAGLTLPSHGASAQAEPRLASLQVQLWPEYDQPSMLVLYDFVVSSATELPINLTFQIPAEANLIAVATRQDDSLLNASYEGPVAQEEWQAFTVNVTSQATYRIEYYQPLDIVNTRRSFNYLWDGAYEVDDFTIEVLQPADVTSFSTEPRLQALPETGGRALYASKPAVLQRGQPYALRLDYEKTSDTLVVPSSSVQPADPIDADTPGRVSVAQYLPYILGGTGLAVLLAGVAYYALAGRRAPRRRRQRHSREPGEASTAAVYCPQCGTRAQAGDRFCRVCGARLGSQEP